ncbi:semaphorin-2A [Biomphalaria pfeifferi]|uniref:Semaphorin-2A n=1 Tax=Biomphalaria pfeifferi TaxID=112525 RepID=A0AAD8BHF1_BIOPF|nr:semaphorin-2A [Biomphalaria pfeifferi]
MERLSCHGSLYIRLTFFVLFALVSVTANAPMASVLDTSGCESVTTLYASDLNLKVFQDGASQPKYYRYLTVDPQSNYLFVGAMNRLVGLHLSDIQIASRRINQEFRANSESVFACRINGKLENLDCQNHVRYLVRNSTMANVFYMCATGAYSPTAYQLKFENDRFTILSESIGIGICPFDPNDNVTAVLIEKGSIGGIPALFAGAVTDFSKHDSIIARLPTYRQDGSLEADYVRTVRSRHDWLNEPQFVGSFDVGPYVYFFFREQAAEYSNCGRKIYSRVARVCKNDLGGSNHLKNIWVSYSKARLNCSIPGEYPYYFDEIQDVKFHGDTFYGLFTTNINGLPASAICGFTLIEIEKAFDSPFKEQKEKQYIWLPVPPGDVPTPRPGNCSAIGKNARYSIDFLPFISRLSMLMDKAVAHTLGRPIFYKVNSVMQRLVVVKNVTGPRDLVLFTATNNGIIYKIAAWAGLTELDPPKTYIVTTYVPFNDQRSIWQLVFHGSSIYFGTDMAVGQLSVETCKKYKKIDLCLYDPYCGWATDFEECVSKDVEKRNKITYHHLDLLSYSLEETIKKQVGNLYNPEMLSKTAGSSVTMKIEYKLHIIGSVRWTRNGTGVSGDRHILAQDNSLIVTDLRVSDEGSYTAVDNKGRTVASYTLVVETSKEQIEQRWMRKFDQWCDEFERYQEDIRQWERKCSSCCDETALANIKVPAIGGGK